jgi:hypothetical protein
VTIKVSKEKSRTFRLTEADSEHFSLKNQKYYFILVFFVQLVAIQLFVQSNANLAGK